MKPNPWLILAVLIALGSFYGYGHHKGWTQRDQEMQVEIARKNNEARKTEQEMTQKLAETSNALQEANNVVTKKQTALDAAIRAGRVRPWSWAAAISSPTTATPPARRWCRPTPSSKLSSSASGTSILRSVSRAIGTAIMWR